MGCEKTHTVKLYFVILQDEAIISQLHEAMETHNLFGITLLYINLDQTTLTVSIIKLFEIMLRPHNWTENTMNFKAQRELIHNWV